MIKECKEKAIQKNGSRKKKWKGKREGIGRERRGRWPQDQMGNGGVSVQGARGDKECKGQPLEFREVKLGWLLRFDKRRKRRKRGGKTWGAFGGRWKG